MWTNLLQIVNLAVTVQNVSKTYPAVDSIGNTTCPPATKFGNGPPPEPCIHPTDPNKLPPSPLESWFTKDVFNDLFPKSNIGWGPNPCSPYSYESFAIAARYFPRFGTESPNNNYTAFVNNRRDVSAFIAHAIQETGENNADLYTTMSKPDADNCFYRGGFFNWFEGGPTSSFLPNGQGHSPSDGQKCITNGRYCASSAEINYWYPCLQESGANGTYQGCYFGRGALQISYNYNYGQFQQWLQSRNITVDLLTNPNLVITKMDPPLAMMASLWFFMTPQPPKPAMHDILMGNWNPGDKNKAAGYFGPIFGPTSLIINNECNGEDPTDPGGPGESRRIKAFKFFCNYFKVPYGPDKLLSCKGMPVKFDALQYNLSYQPDWSTTWQPVPCNCAPASYGGLVSYYDPNYYHSEFVALNPANHQLCVKSVYENPDMYSMNPQSSPCLQVKPPS